MKCKLCYGSITNESQIFVSKIIESSSTGVIHGLKAKETKIPNHILFETERLLRIPNIDIISTKIDSGQKVILSGKNVFGMLDPELFLKGEGSIISQTNFFECFSPIGYPNYTNLMEISNLGARIPTETTLLFEYTELLNIYERLMNGEIGISPKEWEDLLEIRRLISEGLKGKSKFEENSKKCKLLIYNPKYESMPF